MGAFETVDAGGDATRVWVAGDLAPGRPGVVLLHAWWGLNDDATAYADRLAGEGFAVVAPDLFGGAVATTIDGAGQLAEGADAGAVDTIVLAAIDDLAARIGPDAGLATVGFSFGAAWAVWSAAERDRVAATVVYYGTVLGPTLARAAAPVLGHFAESDPYETDDGIEAFADALRSAGRETAILRYPGTGHWFAEPSRDAYRPEAAELAFARTVAFLRRHLAPAGG